MSRPAFTVTPELRTRVQTLAALHTPEAGIAKIIGCSLETLRRRFGRELKLGPAEANAQAAGRLFAKAKGGDLAAIIFWLTSHGWVKAPRKKAAMKAKAAAGDGAPLASPVILIPKEHVDEDIDWIKPIWPEAVARYAKKVARRKRQAQREEARQRKVRNADDSGRDDGGGASEQPWKGWPTY